MSKRFALVVGGLALSIAGAAAAQEMRLTGVLMSGAASLAIISGPDGRGKVVRIGQEINPGATLGEVSPNGVVVLRNQRREWLPLVGGNAGPPVHFAGGQQPPKLTDPAAASQANEATEPRRSKVEQAQQMGASEGAR